MSTRPGGHETYRHERAGGQGLGLMERTRRTTSVANTSREAHPQHCLLALSDICPASKQASKHCRTAGTASTAGTHTDAMDVLGHCLVVNYYEAAEPGVDNRGGVRGLPWGNAVRDDVDSGPLPGFHSQSRSQPGAQERRQTSEDAECIKTDQSLGGRHDTAVVQSVDSRPAAMAMAMLRRPATERVAWVWLTFTEYFD